MKSEYAHQIRQCITNWFPKHQATFSTENTDVQWLNWQAPATSIYCLRYIISGSYLCVIGDAGDAVFQWSQKIDWDFLKSCDLDYFIGKCQASEVGRHFVQWDARKLEREIKNWLEECRPDMPKDDLEDVLEKCRASGCAQEWMDYASDLTEWLGDDYYEFATWGETINVRGIGHWVGLQMATGNTAKMLERYAE